MRIGLDYRLLSAGRMVVNRGMGRYTQQQLREVLRLDTRNEYVLFCREDADLRALLPEIAAASNVSIAWLPPLDGRHGEDLNRPERFLLAAADLQRAVEAQDLDLFHATTPSRLEDLVPARLDGCAVVATHYDLIPLRFPQQYFPAHGDPTLRQAYARSLALTRRADRLVAISEEVKRDVVARLGVRSDHIHVAYPIADPCFRPLIETEREATLRPLRERLDVPEGFLLTVSALHHAKNLATLLTAYAALPPARRRAQPLVLAGYFDESESAMVLAWASERGVAADVRLAGFVSDDELTALYGAATLYVHPSRYEGFGLPVLEAMRCGAAVVAGRGGSVPEVTAGAGVLVDPDDARALALAITALVDDEPRRRALGERALERSGLFTAEQLGCQTLAVYEAVCQLPAPPPKAWRLALWAPLPPQRSGIADYSAEFLRALVAWADVEVFLDDGVVPSLPLFDLAPIHHFEEFERRAADRPFDAIVYQLGASFFHLFMVDAMRRWPGIVTLHDLTWGALLHRIGDLGGAPPEEFRSLLRASEGEGAGAELGEIEAASAPDRGRLMEEFFNRRPLLRAVAAGSLAQIVHVSGARRELEARYPEAQIYEFPMGVEDPLQADPRPGRRWPPGGFRVGIFGAVDPVKRVESVLRAIAPTMTLAVVGGVTDSAYLRHLRRVSAALGVQDRVVFAGRVGERAFGAWLMDADVVVNLRFPFRRQMSATLMRAIAAGKPVVITDVPEWAEFPESFCLRVAADEHEVEVLAGHLAALALDPARVRRMGEAARRHYLEHATLGRMSAHYRRVIEEVALQS